MPEAPKIQPSKDLIYWYGGKVRRVYDGDTIHCDIELGLNVRLEYQRIRLAKINAPELRGRSRRRGKEAADYLRNMIDGQDVLLNTERDTKGKYGRWVATVYAFDYARDGWFEVNAEMVRAGHAEEMPE
jgi:micrococcal nuclease